ncbi:MAG: PKD domain-containing protein, partial [Halanaerobiales bacterium]
IIETDPSIDPDMVDDLTYYFTVVDSTANEIIEREESNLPESELDRHLKYSLSSDELIEGQNYRWWVEVNDGYEYVKSDEVNSLVDLSPPTITYLTEETNDYHDQLIVEVDIKDSVSGMEELEYYWSNDPDNIETINLTENEILTFEAPQGRNVLNIRARDKAANISGWVSRYFVVDNTPPEIDNLSIVAEEIGGDFYVNEEFSFKWEVKEDSAIDYYRYAVVTEEEISSPEALPEEKFNKISVNSNQNNFIQDANISLEEGIKYYILLEVVNKSGFSTGRVVSSNGVFIDNTPPYIKDFELQGVVRNNNKNYLRDLSNLNLSLGITDDGTGLSGISYSFTENINNNNWVETVEEAVSSFTPIDGQSYYLAVKAEDLLGNIEKVYSEAVIFDQTSPDINEIIAGDSLQVKTKDDVYEIGTEQKIPVRLRISDQIPLTNVSYAIGTSEGSNDISENLYPEDDGWINTGSTAYTQEFEIEENLAEGRYYITFRVENSAELVSQESSNPVQVNNNIGSVPEIEDDGLYTAEDTMLHFSWTFEDSDSQPTGFEYQILTAEEELVRNWQLITNISLYDYYAEDLSLENGQEYFIKMRAVYSDSDYSGVGHSNGIKVDTTKPAGLLIDDGDYSNGERLILKWDAEDLESGISKYEIKIGKDPDGSEVTDGWIELDNSGEILLRGLELEHNQIYYTTLRVTNGVDQVSLRGSDGFKVDKTEAPEPVVIDKGKYTNEMFLKFDWELSDRDPESGIKEYHYALLNSKRIPDENEWVNAGLDKEITIDQGLIDGKEYYLAVKAINGAGMESIGYSDGILIDTTAPTPPEVVHESRYQNFQDRIRATFTVEDRESGIDYNEYYIGTIENKEAIRITDNIDEQIEITPVETGQISDGEVTLSGLDLELGEIYFLTVKAINKAGLVSTEGSSLGVKIVESDLEILNLDDYGEYSHFNNMITVDWDCEYTYIPVDYYQVAVSNSSYASNLEWFNVTRNSILITPDMVPADLRDGDKFIDGETYYVHVKAVDTSGYESDIESTDGIKLDSTPPSKPEIIYSDTHTTDKYTLKWSSTEGDSSISTYRYAIGTVRGESDISDGWRYIETDKEIYQEVLNLELLHKETYYLTVQAKNIAGLWSDITYDNGRIADLTPPEKPEVVYQGNREYAGHYITSKDKIEDIFYDSGDPETGITAYRYQLIDTKDDLNWTGIDENQVNEEEFEFTIGDLSLQENQRYYIAVQCRNRLGVWSETGFSEQLIVDTIEPDVSLANQDIELVTNDGRIDVPWDVSETATIYYRLIRPDGSRVPEIGYDTRSADAESEYIYEFNEDSKLEGIYVLEIYAVDEAGNRGDTVSQQIRINAKPVIDLGNNRTQYKGRALELSASVNDSDGEIKEYIWDFGDGSEQSNEVEPSHVYTELNRYKIILSCIDNDGGESSASIFIDITNTLEGQLAMDEIWDGPMNIIDTVIVPEGITLTIESGEVIFPENTSLLVLGTLQVNGMSENQVIFRAETDLWDGIKASGTASKVNIEHSLIKSAERGITLDSINGSVEGNLIGVLLDDNKVGIHLVNVSPVIKECRITNNSLFGIKEDGECEPTLVDNVFLNNQIGDYYDSILTILSPEELEVINND